MCTLCFIGWLRANYETSINNVLNWCYVDEVSDTAKACINSLLCEYEDWLRP